jgi:uncharacterized protein YbaP (TraB family)
MNRILFPFYLWCALLAATLHANPTDTLQNALMWEITSDKSDHTSYLFGTIHIIPASMFSLPETITGRLDRSERLVLELDMDQASDPMTMFALMPKMMMPTGTTLRDLLSEEDYTLVIDELQKMGLPGMMVEGIKPLFLSALMDPSMGGSMEGMASYDMSLYEYAKKKEIAHSGLETIDEQLAAFDRIPLTDQAKMLADQLKAGQGEGDEGMNMQKLFELYLSEDLIGLMAMMDDQSEMGGEAMDHLLDKRNQTWIPRIETMISKESVFIGVGAGHLAGDQGVIQLMRQAGYRLTPVRVFQRP